MNNDLVQNIVDIFGNKQIYYNIPDYQRDMNGEIMT